MQNLISLELSDATLDDLDGTLAAIEQAFAQLIVLQPGQRRELFKMGDKSEAFCRQTLGLLAANPQIVPPNLGLAEAQRDLIALDRLRPRLQRLRQIVERAEDSEMALGSDIIAVALEGYGLLKVSGKSEALKSARRDLSARFAKAARSAGSGPAPASSS